MVLLWLLLLLLKRNNNFYDHHSHTDQGAHICVLFAIVWFRFLVTKAGSETFKLVNLICRGVETREEI